MRGVLILVLALALPAGCASVSYLGQAAWGQARVLAARRPLECVIADPRTQPELRTQLELVRDLRAFAVSDLAMHDASGFEDYAALGRDFAVWNVVATPEFSLRPLGWCYPVAGCVSYRGYFGRVAAERQAASLARQGLETHVYGVAAYSTLGWFDDPVLDTWVRRREGALAALVFHELAHQLVYAPDDTAFSESFARVVEREGVRRWFARSGRDAEMDAWLREQSVTAQFNALLAGARTRLEALYVQPLAAPEMRTRKTEVFAGLRADYEDLSRTWPEGMRFDAWMRGPLNNARLASVASYERWAPALTQLLAEQGGELPAFYAAARALAALAPAAREARLLALERAANMAPPSAPGGAEQETSG
ncbi:MAG: aminopeptidase [Pseudomonadales bacterium]|nr:aminopeptidase [Pseudomonadales bacterium]